MIQPLKKTNEYQQPEIDLNVLPGASTIHDANNAYVEAMSDLMLKHVGICLNHNSKPSDFQFVADFIHQHFAIHFEASSILSNSDLPRYLDPDLSVKIEPEAFTRKLAALELPEPNDDCPIIRNLDWLTDLFNLTFTERKVLLWSYCTFHGFTHAVKRRLHRAKTTGCRDLLFGWSYVFQRKTRHTAEFIGRALHHHTKLLA